MKLLLVCKRHPQQRDLIERPYGRFHHLPVALAALGHEVRVQLCGYRRLDSTLLRRDGVEWSSHDFLTLGMRNTLRVVAAEVAEFRPDWVIGVSDAWAGWLAHRVARAAGSKLAIDAYDNYEAYMPWNLPLHWLWRRAIRAADIVTAAGPQLARKLARSRIDASSVHILPMSADPMFAPMERRACRSRLGLPQDVPLFGYSGGWTRSRGSDLILAAFALVRQQLPDALLVLTGKPPEHALAAPGVRSLGYVDDADMPIVTNAMDVCCVVLANTRFGRYSYPAKLCEAMACRIPVVASDTDAVSWMLHDDRKFVARVGDAADHARLMLTNYCLSRVDYIRPPDWRQSAARFAELLTRSGELEA